jgi:hypothetical protein
MELATAKEDTVLAETRAKESEATEREASAQVLVLQRQVFQLKEGVVPPSRAPSQAQSAPVETPEKKGVKRERDEDGNEESNKRANQAPLPPPTCLVSRPAPYLLGVASLPRAPCAVGGT